MAVLTGPERDKIGKKRPEIAGAILHPQIP